MADQMWTQGEREEKALEASMLRAKGKTLRETAEALGCGANLVKVLLDEEYRRRKPQRERARSKAIIAYEALVREMWRRLAAFPDNASAQNVNGFMGNIRQTLERIDKITGAEAPTKTQHERINVDWSKLPENDLAQLAEIASRNPDVFDALLKEEE
jgi:hypothetical protein